MKGGDAVYIVRVQTGSNAKNVIHTFHFDSEADMNYAANLLGRTPSRGFSAETSGSDETRGIVRKSWDRRQRLFDDRIGRLELTVQSGAYRDSVWELYGYKDECEAEAEETNGKAMSYFSTSAFTRHVAGDLYKVVFTTPYND